MKCKGKRIQYTITDRKGNKKVTYGSACAKTRGEVAGLKAGKIIGDLKYKRSMKKKFVLL